MARSPAASDPFSAIAEPRRRLILDAIGAGRHPVNWLAETLDLPQPVVSKHLAVLRDAGVLGVTRQGRQRLYHIEPEGLRAVHAWVASFEKLWDSQLERIKRRAEEAARAASAANKESR